MINQPYSQKDHDENNDCTLSINHNWITPSSIDRTWDCIYVELLAVNEELNAWGNCDDVPLVVKEKMLKSCVGLNVSSFFLLLLNSTLQLLVQFKSLIQDSNEYNDVCYSQPTENDSTKDTNINFNCCARKNTEGPREEIMFDFVCLYKVLKHIMTHDKDTNEHDDTFSLRKNVEKIHLEQRLLVVSKSKTLAENIISIATTTIQIADELLIDKIIGS